MNDPDWYEGKNKINLVLSGSKVNLLSLNQEGVKNKNFKKHFKIYSTSVLSCSVQKPKRDIFEKWDHFENRPSWKAHSLWKIGTLSQKLKFQKTCQYLFYKWFTVVLCKELLEKTPNIREMRPFWISAIMESLEALQNWHFGS